MALDGWILESSPFHDGEIYFQKKTGHDEVMDRFGRRVIRQALPEQHRDFYRQLPFLALGAVDQEGWPWASLVFGSPGFAQSLKKTDLSLAPDPLPGDPVLDVLAEGEAVGLLGIELHTRRRNRMNGHITGRDAHGWRIQVDQSFGNCPQYIQDRGLQMLGLDAYQPGEPQYGEALSDADRAMIERADTFFIASYVPRKDHPEREGVDVSHRGGRPGFVKVEEDALVIPDFTGNYHFNTLGNLHAHPRAGLLFVDFDSGDMLFLSGEADAEWDDPDQAYFRGAERVWRFAPKKRVRIAGASPLRGALEEMSPNSSLTGTWAEARALAEAERLRETWRPYRVTKIVPESAVISSFYLEPDDGAVRPGFEPGQFLPIRVPAGEAGEAFVRTYTISSAPDEPGFRLSIKREDAMADRPAGQVSSWMHRQLQVGDVIEARAPRGAFTFETRGERPAVLIGAGVGITPMMSMTRQAVIDSVRNRYLRPLTVIQAARNARDRAFENAFQRISRQTEGQVRYVRVTSHPETDEPGLDEPDHWTGYISPDLLRATLALDDYEVYLCGPPPFMQAVYDALRTLGVADARIFAEAFGPASLTRQPDAGTATAQPDPVAKEALVHFKASDVEQRWTPEEGSLLDLAENHGLTPASGCRNGACGSCRVGLLKGKVAYDSPPAAGVTEDTALICCARPAEGSDSVELDL